MMKSKRMILEHRGGLDQTRRLATTVQFKFRRFSVRWRHPERSRFSGGAKDLARIEKRIQDIKAAFSGGSRNFVGSSSVIFVAGALP
jgi:hypothetical protein